MAPRCTALYIFIVTMTAGCGGAEFSAFDRTEADGGTPLVDAPDSAPATSDSGTGGAGGATGTGGAPAEIDGGTAGASGGSLSTGGELGSGGASSGGTGGAAPCLTDLSSVGTGDFRISFTLTTTDVPAPSTYMALLNQRSSCDDTQPGWDVWMTAQGNLGVEVYDGSGGAYDNITDSRSINDGAPHRVAVARSGSSLTIGVDGVFNTYPNEPIMSLATLPSVNTGIDPTCTGVRNISGRLTDVCFTK